VYTVTTFIKLLSKTIFSINTLSLCLSTFTTLSTHFSATNIPTPSDLSLPPIQNSLYLLPWAPKNLQPQPVHLVSWIHPTSTSLSTNASTSSPALPVNESTFQVPTRNPLWANPVWVPGVSYRCDRMCRTSVTSVDCVCVRVRVRVCESLCGQIKY